jgi:hypothetical protein
MSIANGSAPQISRSVARGRAFSGPSPSPLISPSTMQK